MTQYRVLRMCIPPGGRQYWWFPCRTDWYSIAINRFSATDRPCAGLLLSSTTTMT